jgi:hypothetical protein
MKVTSITRWFFLFFAFQSAVLCAEDFSPKRNLWSLGGSASLPFKGTEKGVLSLKLNLEPLVSWYVWDHIEILARPKLGVTLLSGEKNGYWDPVSWGLGIQTRYVFGDKQTIFPYVGLLGGVSLQNSWAETIEWRGGFWTGFLVVLKDRWVLDVGFPIAFAFSPARFQYVEVVLGQLGFSYYF